MDTDRFLHTESSGMTGPFGVTEGNQEHRSGIPMPAAAWRSRPLAATESRIGQPVQDSASLGVPSAVRHCNRSVQRPGSGVAAEFPTGAWVGEVDLQFNPWRNMSCGSATRIRRGVAQLVEHRSPKPRVGGSSPFAPAIAATGNGSPAALELCRRRVYLRPTSGSVN